MMKAVVYHGKQDVRVDDVPRPTIQDPRDAIVKGMHFIMSALLKNIHIFSQSH